ncbi:hypothetical protein FRC11_012522, partial [Ceratobasidium sp. 423]
MAMGIGAESQLWHVILCPSGIPFLLQLQERCSHSCFTRGEAVLLGHHLVLPTNSPDTRILYDHDGTLILLHEDIAAAYQELVDVDNLVSAIPLVERNTSLPSAGAPEVNLDAGINPAPIMLSGSGYNQISMQVDPDSSQESLPAGSVGTDGTSSSSEQPTQAPAPTLTRT